MSNRRSGRSWYRLSSIVRPTAYSSRDPSSPNYVSEPPLSPTASPSPPPPPRSPPKVVREAKPSPVLSPRPSINYESPKRRHERETTSQKILKFSDNTNLVHGPKKEQQREDKPSLAAPHSPPPPPRSPPNEVRETKPSPGLLSRSIKHEPPKEQEQQSSYMDQTRNNNNNNNNTMMSPAAQPSHPPPQVMSPPLRPPSPEEIQEAKPTLFTSSPPLNHEPPKPRQESKTTHQKSILTLSEKTDIVHGPKETLLPESDDDVIMGTQSVITISGENKGAVMEILRSPNKTRGPFLFNNDAKKSAEEKSISKSKSKSKSKNQNNNGESRFVNSNVQIINGSVVYNSSEIHHDPGVHLSLCRKPSSGNGFINKDHGNGYTSSIN
ncbi:PREDICTED: pollen-specific leucine-rich repeat extensin-like protein 1 [Camelina sativa]|uniref:Pollen-specific leucine-rich repeat extensin-like protein 1 n=1 Tax=Camelina sativa TaxID=90675 RepID=A0ABM0ZCF4_CAMSA|nr:PREDICTED: pollen-specific leucine-rich repeat extensin-like protein 1 [Camelina sativa]